ncbi:hypothetical protein [Staphylococcus simulans]|uniref:hypothetical protein n=1 Tax=Staphylococcus simulans TaxID=1286 RepID=UPI002DB7B950|nr:hypothetical protein [Staphylococcus simulans]MEB6838051.1 hypothetical protein [Staphylococcus simulans]
MYTVLMGLSGTLFLGCLVVIISETISNKILRKKGLNPKAIFKHTNIGKLILCSKILIGIMLIATLIFWWLANQSEADKQKKEDFEEELSTVTESKRINI